MTVGLMIGSGVFMLPAVLAPYGSLSFLGWLLTSVGAIAIALVLGRLASRTEKSGGFYVYTQEAFGDLTGFIVAWGYWLSTVFGIAAITVAFAGYLGSIVPSIGASGAMQAFVAAVLIWSLTAINIKGVDAGATLQLLTTLLKLIPLIVIILLGIAVGDTENIPPFNPGNKPVIGAIAATALLTMWAFLGIEGGTVAAADVNNPKRTIPRSIVIGTLTAAFIYIAATAAVMMLVPADILATSEAPFVDAAGRLGSWGGTFIAVGALVATAGAANASILLAGQMPLAVSLDGLAPKFLSRRNSGGAPVIALVLSAIISTILLVFNYSGGLIAAFTFMISMSTLCLLLPYMLSSVAELRVSWRSAKGWAGVALLAIVYSAIAIVGSGVQIIIWGVVLFLMGLPIYYMTKYSSSK